MFYHHRWHAPIFQLLCQINTRNRKKDLFSSLIPFENKKAAFSYLPKCSFDEEQHINQFGFSLRVPLSDKIQINDSHANIFAQLMQSETKNISSLNRNVSKQRETLHEPTLLEALEQSTLGLGCIAPIQRIAMQSCLMLLHLCHDSMAYLKCLFVGDSVTFYDDSFKQNTYFLTGM